jgi:hypothetical protein
MTQRPGHSARRTTIIAAICASALASACLASPPSPPPRPATDVEAAWRVVRRLCGERTLDDENLDRKVDGWVEQLDSPDWRLRERATEHLLDHSEAIGDRLRTLRDADDPEIAGRAAYVLRRSARIAEQGVDLLAQAVDTIARAGDPQVIPRLIKLLDHPSQPVRYEAEYAIRRITGVSHGYAASGDEDRRRRGIAAWKAWWTSRRDDYEPLAPPTMGLALCNNTPQAVIVALDGTVVKELEFDEPVTALTATPKGTLLAALTSRPGRAVEVDWTGKTLWSSAGARFIEGPVSEAHRLPDGNTLLALPHDGMVAAITRKGRLAWKHDGLKHCHSAVPAGQGKVLITEHLSDRAFLVDRRGKVLWEKKEVSRTVDAWPIGNGNVLIAGFRDKNVIEVDPEGRTVWEVKVNGIVSGVCRLPDGRTAVAGHYRGYLIYDRDGKHTTVLRQKTEVFGKLRPVPLPPGQAP